MTEIQFLQPTYFFFFLKGAFFSENKSLYNFPNFYSSLLLLYK